MACDCVKSAATGNLAVYTMVFKEAGEFNEGHAHSYHHLLFVCAGSIDLESIGSGKPPSRHDQFALIWIPKGIAHRYVAREPWTAVACLHAIHKKDDPGDVLDDAEIPGGTPDWTKAVPLLMGEAKRAIADFDKL